MQYRLRNLALVLVLCALAVVALAQLALAEDASTQAVDASTWPPVFRVAMLRDISTTNYWRFRGWEGNAYNQYVLEQSVLTLFTNADARFQFVPRLAAGFGSAPVLQGGLWAIEVPLRQGITWSDGTPFTSDDILFTLGTCGDLELSGSWSQYWDEDLDHVEATGPYTVTYFFKEEPGLGLWQARVALHPVLPQHYWQPVVDQAILEADPEAYLYEHVPVGEPVLGPFLPHEWVPGSYVEIHANPNYYFQGLEVKLYESGAYQETLPGEYVFIAYGAAGGVVDLEFTVGPHTGGVRYTIYTDQAAAYQALLAGQVDYVLQSNPIDGAIRQQLELDPDVTTAVNQDYGMYYMAFNLRKSPQDVPEFREAVAVLTDRDFPGTIVGDSTQPLYGFMPEGNAPWYNPNIERTGEGLTRQERIDEAVSLLTSAGFTWTVEPSWNSFGGRVDPGHGLHHNGASVPELQLLAPDSSYDPVRASEALSIGQWLNDAGISVTVALTGFDHMLGPVFVDADFDLYILGWSLGNINFPDYFYNFWHSSQDTQVSGRNNTPGYNNPVYDALSEELLTTSDLIHARDVVSQLQVMLAEDLPYVTLHTKVAFDAYYDDWITFPYTDALGGIEFQSGMPELVSFIPVQQTVTTGGGTVESTLASTEIEFPAGAFSETVVVSFTVAPPIDAGDLERAGPVFDLSAVYSETGLPADLESGMSFTTEVTYGDIGVVNEDSLGLYWWNEGANEWSLQGISNTVNVTDDVVTAEISHFSTFALLGESFEVYLPVIVRME